MSLPTIENLLKNKKQSEGADRFRKISNEIHTVLVDNRADALEAELILSQMAQNYVILAKKSFQIYDKSNELPK